MEYCLDEMMDEYSQVIYDDHSKAKMNVAKKIFNKVKNFLKKFFTNLYGGSRSNRFPEPNLSK